MSGDSSRIRLSLIARPGIAIRVLDGALAEVDRGVGRLDTWQPQGLYLIEWSSAGRQSQTIARLDGSEEEVVVRFDPSGDPPDAAQDPAGAARRALVDAVNDVLRPSERSYESRVVLIVAGAGDAVPADAELELRLLNRDDVAVKLRTPDLPNLALAPGERALCYRVRPGRYHIGFRSFTGERLGQSIPVLAGRQTLVFMTAAKTNLLVADGETFDEQVNVGIDPGRTVVITVRGDEEEYRVRERVRLAGLLLYDLAVGGISLAADVVAVLDDALTDPLVKLYGALVALACIERGVSPSPEVDPSDGLSAAEKRDWGSRIRGWIAEPGLPGLPTDAIAAWWALRRLMPGSAAKSSAALPTRIETPPMLECAWRWAIEESVERPDAVRCTAIVAAAGRTGGGTAPWLCWKAAAAKAQSTAEGAGGGELPDLIRQIARRVVEVVGDLAGTDNLTRAVTRGLDMLSPEVQATALRAAQLATPGLKIDEAMVKELAVVLGLPSRQLQKRLIRTRSEIDAVAAQVPATGPADDGPGRASDSVPPEAPGLSRRIEDADDLQKGRFGGRRARGGFTLSATFAETRSKSWIRVGLRVEGPAEDGDEVEFHLHDSFRPSLKTRRFADGAAELAVTAWGGFTVGVWIPTRELELELDLARLAGAPYIIRTR